MRRTATRRWSVPSMGLAASPHGVLAPCRNGSRCIALNPFVADAAGRSGFCTSATPLSASRYAQVPRPEHIRRSDLTQPPQGGNAYTIRYFLLTDSVVYAPLTVFGAAVAGRITTRQCFSTPTSGPNAIHQSSTVANGFPPTSPAASTRPRAPIPFAQRPQKKLDEWPNTMCVR